MMSSPEIATRPIRFPVCVRFAATNITCSLVARSRPRRCCNCCGKTVFWRSSAPPAAASRRWCAPA